MPVSTPLHDSDFCASIVPRVKNPEHLSSLGWVHQPKMGLRGDRMNSGECVGIVSHLQKTPGLPHRGESYTSVQDDA